MLSTRLVLLLTAVLALALSVHALAILPEFTSEWTDADADLALSNGERIARGLKPKAPRRLYEPTRTHALAARQSPGAPNGALLRAAYANDPDATIGYISLSKELNGFIGLVQGTADADTFLAPTTLPVTGTSLPIISVDYGSGYFLYTQPDELDGETAYFFTGGRTGQQPFDVSAEPDREVTLFRNGVQQLFYIPPTGTDANLLRAGTSAQVVNTVFGLGITEADQVVLNLVN